MEAVSTSTHGNAGDSDAHLASWLSQAQSKQVLGVGRHALILTG